MEAIDDMCFLCFEALENKVSGSNKTTFSSKIPKGDKRECPMFVTWKKDGDLRGCIGIFRDIPLWEGLQEYAIIAGTQDSRFSPIKPAELPHLECGISLLHSFEPAKDALDWEIGKHGIRLFIDGCQSTFLPEVASEQGWDKMETLRYLARKGGFRGKLDESALKRARVERYQSAKHKVTWEQYVAAQK